MSEAFSIGDAILFMKVGTHAQEPLDEIIKRKRREIERAGFAMWGYGGNTCHPASMVQPFARRASQSGRILLCMQPMNSKHFAEQLRAEEYSIDGRTWERIPKDINVRGSRYALCIGNLEEVDEKLALAETRVAVGNSRGRRGSDYVRGRVDKACLEIAPPDEESQGDAIDIKFVAEVIEPFAVFLRA